MDLELELSRVRGRARRDPVAVVVRELTQADLAELEVERGVKPQALTRLRERHHGLARALAGGMSEQEAAAVTGYDKSRISVLKGDPAFQELLSFYRENVNAEYVAMHELLAGMSKDAALLLREKLEECPDDMTVAQLLEITKMGADRTGHGPSSTSTQVNVHVDMAERLEKARERLQHAKVIEHEPSPGVSRSGDTQGSPREAGEWPQQSPPVRGSGDTNGPPVQGDGTSHSEDD